MATRRRDTNSDSPKRAPATTPEARENQLIAAAVDLAAKQIEEGTASSQVITHFLKLGSSREKLEQERLANENSLLEIKREVMQSVRNVEELYAKALDAMRSYQGHEPEPEQVEGDYYD